MIFIPTRRLTAPGVTGDVIEKTQLFCGIFAASSDWTRPLWVESRNASYAPVLKVMSYKVPALVKCGDISLKITLTDKHLTKGQTLVECLITPFLGAYNKKKTGEPVSWSDVKCVQIDGFTIFDLDVPAKGLLKSDEPVVKLVMSIDSLLPQSFIDKAQVCATASDLNTYAALCASTPIHNTYEGPMPYAIGAHRAHRPCGSGSRNQECGHRRDAS